MGNTKDKSELITRNVQFDSEFLGELMTENAKMNNMRKKNGEKKINSSEEIIELAKEGLEQRRRIRNIS